MALRKQYLFYEVKFINVLQPIFLRNNKVNIMEQSKKEENKETSKSADWNLILQGYMSILWLQECAKDENLDKSLRDLRSEFEAKYPPHEKLNIGVLVMAAYLCFLYPKESEVIGKMPDKGISIDKFTVTIPGIKKGNENEIANLLRRIRNSLAHANFTDGGNAITFHDQNPNNSEDIFEAEILYSDFGDFINTYIFVSKDEKFKDANSKPQ